MIRTFQVIVQNNKDEGESDSFIRYTIPEEVRKQIEEVLLKGENLL